MNEALAVRLQHRYHLFAVVDLELRDQFAAGDSIPAGDDQFLGIAIGIGDRAENAFLPMALFPPEPIESGDEACQGRADDHGYGEGEKKNIIRRQARCCD